MKIAVTSSSFAFAFGRGTITQLEWLDMCANELEVDGVVFDLGDFPRTDGEYLAQLKKNAIDLGLSVAAVSQAGDLPDDATFAIANALGAPIAIGVAPRTSDDPDTWNVFVEAAKTCARAAKKANVVVGLAPAPGTLCPDAAGLRRIAYDVDGSWLRFAVDPLGLTPDDARNLLAKTVIARSKIADLATFATAGEASASAVIEGLARFRGFIVLESKDSEPVTPAYHAAIARFATARAEFLQRELGRLSRLDRA